MTINLSSKGSNLYPSLKSSVYGDASFRLVGYSRYTEGFLGNGDFFYIPTNGVDDLKYYNIPGAEQWSVGPSDVNASCDRWVGMVLDDTDGIVYAIAVDVGTTPKTYYTCSINFAGTITNIGNDQPSVVDFINGLWMGGEGNDGDDDTTLVQRASTGSGNLFIRQGSFDSTPDGMFEAEINISTGAFVSHPTVVSTWGTFMAASYKTESGIYIGYFTLQVAYSRLVVQIHDTVTNTINIPESSVTMRTSSNGMKPMVWKDKVHLLDTTIYPYGPSTYDKTDFDAWVDKLAVLAAVR